MNFMLFFNLFISLYIVLKSYLSCLCLVIFINVFLGPEINFVRDGYVPYVLSIHSFPHSSTLDYYEAIYSIRKTVSNSIDLGFPSL